MYTCSADKTIGVWDLVEGKRIKKYKDHEGVVNSIQAAHRGEEVILALNTLKYSLQLFVTTSDDCTVRLWDERVKKAVDKTELNYQTTSAVFNDTNEYIFYGGVDNQIKAWNIGSEDREEFTLLGHVDTITGKKTLQTNLHRLKLESQRKAYYFKCNGQNYQNVGHQPVCNRRIQMP